MFKLSYTVVITLLMLFNQNTPAEDRIMVKSTPPGATVYLNGENTRRKTPTNVPVKLGDLIELRLSGYQVHQFKHGSAKSPVEVKLEESVSFKLNITTLIGNQDWAGTDGVILTLSLNGNPNYRVKLDNPGTADFEPGSADSFSFTFNFPLKDLNGLRLAMEKGNDAWFCDSMKLQFETEDGKFKSKTVIIPVKTWLCAEQKGNKLRKFVDIPIKNLKLFESGLKN